MFCPQCGQQQVAGVIRFCSRCGFPLDGVLQLLSNGGSLPVYRTPDEPVPISARRKGVKQGGLLLLSGAVLVPVLGIFSSYSNSAFLEILTALAAIICFIGGPLRMLFAAVFEEGTPKPVPVYGAAPMHVPQQFAPQAQKTAAPRPPPPPHPPRRERARTN